MAKRSRSLSAAERSTLIRAWQGLRSRWRLGLAAGLLFALTVILLEPPPATRPFIFEDRATEDIRAPEDIAIVDPARNAAERARIEGNYERWWSFDGRVRVQARGRLARVFDILGRENPPEAAFDLRRINDEIKQAANIFGLSDADVNYLLSSVDLGKFRDDLSGILERTYESHFIVRDLDQFKIDRTEGRGRPAIYFEKAAQKSPLEWGRNLETTLKEFELRAIYEIPRDRREIELGVNILRGALAPDLEFDRVTTGERYDADLKKLEESPITQEYKAGELIARAGESLAPVQAAAARWIAGRMREAYPYRLAGAAALAAFAFAAIGIYLGRIRREITFTASSAAMVCLPILITLVAGRILMRLDPFFPELRLISTLFPAPLLGMLTAIIVGTYAGFSLVLVTVVAFGFCAGLGIEFTVFSLLSGFSAVVLLHSLRQRRDVIHAGLRVGLINIAAVCLIALFHFPLDKAGVETLGWESLLAFGNAVVSGGATLPLIVVFERMFGVVTDIRLLELTGPHHPLIRQLEDKAPGTYQHVLNVTKLAESAAEAIGANFLLVRAGAYFHDIGKMLKPKYFSENQVTFEDRKGHSKISPYMSVLIIKNHVKEGIELGRKFGLPEKIIDFIPQHHGTSLIRYFYNEATRRYEESESVDVVREEDFRYPGPRPQSIETAIVLLADSVEAIATATFVSPQVNENELRRTVGKAITERFNDGQFDECDLTMRDLSAIRESFVQTLKARFHFRIAYPSAPRRAPAAEPREGAAAPVAPVAASS